ncbi:MAG: hypothetical protein Q8M93_22045 [Polaromonas sp.]|uniref:hypothetical protein n=2 Tax=Polaromonas sp. TaxID=1869339 RepID=UPI00272FD009|nr:hypothetical protein [Polaromonas sp.]MDP2448309.1 hypothetical protein [Polaromonas sp.]MDP3249633.1 hypothetical protein [Polaromonas sp.]
MASSLSNPSNQPGQSEGMPARTPAAGRPRPGRAETPADASDEASLALPHERDQSTDMTDTQPDPQVRQASRDLRRGLQDTGKSAPMDKAYDRLKR